MARRNQEISKGIDTTLILLYLALVTIGIISIFSVTYQEGTPVLKSFLEYKTDYSKQFYFFILSLFVGLFITLTDSKFFTATANIWYVVGILMLLLVFPFHTQIKGTESIIRFGSIQVQPAEICKIPVALALAKYLSRIETDFSKFKSQLIGIAICLFPAVLTIMQKETGLALVFFAFFLVMFREGLPPSYLIIGFSLAVLIVATLVVDKDVLAIILTVVASIGIYLSRKQIKKNKGLLFSILLIWAVCVGIQRFAVPFIFQKVLQPHHVERVFSLIGKENPYVDPAVAEANAAKKHQGIDYNVRQSKIAIGSGGFSGKGLLKGTQTRFDFVPEQRTDFIFCTIGEGFGFLGSVVFLGLYFFFLLRIVFVAERQRSTFSRVFAYSLASVLFFHIAINICMTIGLAPVIGITLPYISYGGTSLLTFSVMFFILIRLDADRQMILR